MSAGHAQGPGCFSLAERLSDYLDRDLDPDTCARIERHLDDCPPCKAFLESLRRTVDLVRGAPSRPELPDAVRDRILDAYRKAGGR
jgi:anti-sigma factor RsiW